jgi:CRP-like cAMP-binding protein
VHLTLKQVVQEPDEPLTHVYFPLSGMLSLLIVMEDGASVEVATVGNEGIVGLSVVLGRSISHTQTICQIAGDAMRLEVPAFREAAGMGSTLMRVLLGYAQARYDHVTQTAACNRHHSTEERCARWLLMTRDRVRGDHFPLTHEFLASILDVRRSTITLTASALQHAGLIRYRRGYVTILDRPGLEAVACECYWRIRATYDHLLG